MAPEVGFEPTT